ncbi:MAG: Bbp16 family capsid cement protein [Bradyrhizobium sp.]
MFTDSKELMSDAQSLTATAISTYVIDLLPNGGGAIGAGRAGGPTANTTVNLAGQPLYLHIRVQTELDSAGEAATLIASLESSADTSNGTPTVHWTTSSIAEATLATGYWIAKGIAIPQGSYKRYLCVNYTVGTENFTSGKVSAWLSDTPTYVEDLYSRGTLTGVN